MVTTVLIAALLVLFVFVWLATPTGARQKKRL